MRNTFTKWYLSLFFKEKTLIWLISHICRRSISHVLIECWLIYHVTDIIVSFSLYYYVIQASFHSFHYSAQIVALR